LIDCGMSASRKLIISSTAAEAHMGRLCHSFHASEPRKVLSEISKLVPASFQK
jgi:hypothetical protein